MTGILPSYQRFVNGVPVPIISRRSFRLREKYLIISVLLTFGVVWLGALFYLPEFRSSGSSVNDSVYSVYKRIQKAGPELLLPPPLAQNDIGGDSQVEGTISRHNIEGEDPHVIEDRNRLKAKIEEEMGMKVLERPQFEIAPVISSSRGPSKGPVDALELPGAKGSNPVSKSGPLAEPSGQSSNKYIVVPTGPDTGPDLKNKLETIKDNLLLELIKERVHDLENKNTDTNTNNKKKNAWVAVNESFNSMCKGGHRTTAQLKGQWGQTKVNKKKEICALRKELFKTGGGGPPQIPPDNSQDITAWLPQEFTIDNNEFDSDNPIVIGGNSTVETTSPIPPMKEEYTVVIEQDVGLQHDKENAMPKHESIIDDKKEKKVKKSEKKKDFASQKIDEIAEAELKLHSAKMRNQERKARNLDLEYEVLQAKLDYYKNKKDKQQEK